MIIMPIVTVIVCYNSRYVQTWTVASKTLNGRWMYVEYMYGMHFINLFWIPRRERAKTTIYTLQISKMDAVKITRAYFQVVINVSSETAWTIIDQGLDEFDSLVEFTEEDMKTLCTTIRLPGRIMINPRANIADQPPTIREPGHLISMVAEKQLLMSAYAEMHQSLTSRPIDSQ